MGRTVNTIRKPEISTNLQCKYYQFAKRFHRRLKNINLPKNDFSNLVNYFCSIINYQSPVLDWKRFFILIWSNMIVIAP